MKTYYVEPLGAGTNAAIAALLEQKAVASECRSRICADGREHSVWDISADNYAVLKNSAARLKLHFRTWTELAEGERVMLLETIEGNITVSGAKESSRRPIPFRSNGIKGSISDYLHRNDAVIRDFIHDHYKRA